MFFALRERISRRFWKLSLTCVSSTNPEAELAWRKEGGGRVLGNFPTLDIGVVSRTDMGTYTCTATNALGVSAPEAVDVVTYCKCSTSKYELS